MIVVLENSPKEGKFPCSVCGKGVECNSILCRITGRLREDNQFVCKKCRSRFEELRERLNLDSVGGCVQKKSHMTALPIPRNKQIVSLQFVFLFCNLLFCCHYLYYLKPGHITPENDNYSF